MIKDGESYIYAPLISLKLNEMWYVSASECWDINHYCLSTDGKVLFYSGPKAIYSYDPDNKEVYIAFMPLVGRPYENIFGFTYNKGYFIYSVHLES
ncbi:MAG: hypothetical protein IKU19_06965, partial [Clostridia bacterium]|nr:hypothetical protein [Clostridia bacterium]